MNSINATTICTLGDDDGGGIPEREKVSFKFQIIFSKSATKTYLNFAQERVFRSYTVAVRVVVSLFVLVCYVVLMVLLMLLVRF